MNEFTDHFPGECNKMRRASFLGTIRMFLGVFAALAVLPMAQGQARGQVKAEAGCPGPRLTVQPLPMLGSPKAIEENFDRQLLELDQRRLNSLAVSPQGRSPPSRGHLRAALPPGDCR